MLARRGRVSGVAGGGNSAGQAALFMAEAGSPSTIVVRSSDLSATMSRATSSTGSRPTRASRCGRRRRSSALTVTDRSRPFGSPGLTASTRHDASGCSPSSVTNPHRNACRDAPPSTTVASCSPTESFDDQRLNGRWDALGRRPLPFETSQPGLFAVGDVRSGSSKRVATAVSEGSAVVGAVHEYLAFALSVPGAPAPGTAPQLARGGPGKHRSPTCAIRARHLLFRH
jgi:thioredoxin reductase (NADPH)